MSMINRVLIVDVSHIAHNFAHVPAQLSSAVMNNGEQVTVNTTIQTGIIKNITRWSQHGNIPTLVCFDRPCRPRKDYFRELFRSQGKSDEYKGGRAKSSGPLLQALNMTEYLLRDGGVACAAQEGYEADDLVKAGVDLAKKEYPDCYIDVVTNDTDLVPLVDEQVSVFLRSQKGTWAEDAFIEKNKYIQITPYNYSEVLGQRSDYKSMRVPWNTLLLVKMLRGDTSDNIPGFKRNFPPRKVQVMLDTLEDNDINVVYDYHFEDTLCDLLLNVVGIDSDMVPILLDIYRGMNLNGELPGRLPAIYSKPFTGFDTVKLQQAVSPLKIRIPA